VADLGEGNGGRTKGVFLIENSSISKPFSTLLSLIADVERIAYLYKTPYFHCHANTNINQANGFEDSLLSLVSVNHYA